MDIFYYLCFLLWGMFCAKAETGIPILLLGCVVLWLLRFLVVGV